MSRVKPVLKVAHIVPSLDVGGLERMMLDFSRFADREAFDPIFFAVMHRGSVADLLEADGNRVVVLDKPPGLKLGAVPRLAGMLRAAGIEVVHTHNNAAMLYGVLAGHLAGVRRIIHTRHLHEPESAGLDGVLRLIARTIGAVVCVSEDTRRVAIEQRMPQGNLLTIRNGIDISRFAPQPPVADGPVVTAARLTEQKDIGNLLRAIAIARKNGRPISAEIAGGGPLREALEQEAADLGITDLVRFVGEMPGVGPLLARARLFVLPSIAEGLPLAILEAMASGRPVLATDVGGNREAVADGETGRLVPARDSEALAAALVDLTADPERLARMGEAGRARIERMFDVRATIRAYEQLYRGQVPDFATQRQAA